MRYACNGHNANGKWFLHWGHDISPEENQYQAGLSFAISYKKNTDFLGKDALLKIKDKNRVKMTMLTLKNKKAGEPLLFMMNQFI